MGARSNWVSRDSAITLLDNAVVAVPAAIACTTTLGTKSFWLDEAYSVHYALMGPWNVVTEVAVQDPNMALYYTLLSLWVKVAGAGEVAARLPSVVCVILSAPLAYFIALRLFGRAAGLLSGALLGLNAFAVQYGQFARGYALLMLLTLLATWIFLVDLDRPSRLRKMLYSLVVIVAFHVHYFAALVVAAHFAALVLIRRRNAFQLATVLTGAVIALWVTSMSALAMGQGLARIDWLQRPAGTDLRDVFLQFTGGDPLLLSLLAGTAFAGTIIARHDGKSEAVTLVVTWLLVPIAVAFFLSQVRPMFSARYLISSLPPLIMLASYGLTRVRPRYAAAIGAGLMIVLSAAGVRFWHHSPSIEQWREAVAYVRSRFEPGDGIVFVPSYLDVAFDYYMKRSEGPELAHLQQPEPARSRTWLVVTPQHYVTHARELDAVRRALAQTHRLRETMVFEQLRVEQHGR